MYISSEFYYKKNICVRLLLEVVSLNQLSVYSLCITIIKEYMCLFSA